MDEFAKAGIEWWNGETEQMRRYWCDMARSARPADAYQTYLAYLADKASGTPPNEMWTDF